MTSDNLVLVENLTSKIYTIRNTKVMLDSDLAELYGVETGVLNQAVKRNNDRFPKDFMFQLTENECEILRSQFATSSLDNINNFPVNASNNANRSISQFVISNTGRGGRKKLPFVFTEQGIAMLSGVLKSKRAILINIYIMRAFISMRQLIHKNADLFVRVDNLENKQIETDKKVEKIFDAISNKSVLKAQGVFYDGQIFDAYLFINDLFKNANKSIILIDNYIDESVLVLFSNLKNIEITIYTDKITEKLKLDLEKYNNQYSNIKLKHFTKSHDRFLILDKKEIYHLGASIKDLGKRWVAFSKLDKDSLTILDRLD